MLSRRRANSFALRSADFAAALRQLGSACDAACPSVSSALLPAISAPAAPSRDGLKCGRPEAIDGKLPLSDLLIQAPDRRPHPNGITATREHRLAFPLFRFELACRKHSRKPTTTGNSRGNSHAPSRTPHRRRHAQLRIGRAIAQAMPARARGCVLDVNEGGSGDRQRNLRGQRKAESFVLDVTKRDDCVAIARQIAAKVGQVSILVNNAGIARRNGMLGPRKP